MSLGKGKRNMGEEDDEEYRPLEGEKGLSSSSKDNEKYCSVGEDDSSRYRMKKVALMAPSPARKSARLSSAFKPTELPMEGAQSSSAHSHPAHSQPALPLPALVFSTPTEASSIASALSKRRVRGLTQGKKIEKLVEQSGKLIVEIPEECNVPVGPNATAVATELGKEIRGTAPLRGIGSWLEINVSLRAAIIQRALDKFDIKEYATNPKVQIAIDKNACYYTRTRGLSCI